MLSGGENNLMIRLAVSTEYRRVTDRYTDGQTDGRTDILWQHSPVYASSRGNNVEHVCPFGRLSWHRAIWL